MTRGASARGRRTARRAAERRQQEGVNEALELTAAATVTADEETDEYAIPADANYREATNPARECDTCAAFSAGQCSMWDAAVEADYTCDEWEAREASATAAGFTPRDRTRLALCAAGVVETEPEITTSFELTNGTLGEREFLSQTILAGFHEVRRSSWPSEGTLGDHGTVLFRTDTEGVFLLEDGSLAHVQIAYGWCQVRVAASKRDSAIDTVTAFSTAYPPLYRQETDDTTVPITFWTNGKYGPTARLRMIESASWEEIEGNYSAQVRDELAGLMSGFDPGKDGQLLLWQGSPGTGKTWALRALASEWAPWAEFNYITDPDAFFVSDPSYMIDVLLHESYESLTVDGDVVTDGDPNGKWRVLILEDTGELLSANAKEAYGQGLSRLLNVVDGMVGQGLRILALVTTNDELGDLHPAAVRPGRCASQIEFGPLSEEEAQTWLGEGADVDGPKTLAELYEVLGRGAFGELEIADTMPLAAMPCAECSHGQMSHYGDDNMGACSMEDCSCEGFVAESSSDTEEASITATGLALNDGFTVTPLTFTAVPYVQTAGTNTNMSGMQFTLKNFEILAPELQPNETIPVASDEIVQPVVPSGALKWTAIFAPEGKPTDDGRIFAPGSITWRELPLTLMAMIKTEEGHDGAEVSGRIDEIWRDEEAGLIRACGEFDTGDYGVKIAGLVAEQILRGVSVDIAVSEMEIAYRDDVLDAEGNWAEVVAEEGEESETPNMLDVMFGDENAAVIFVVRKGVIGAATVCPFPAFAEATIELASSLVASANPMVWTVTQQAGFVVTAEAAQEGLTADESVEDEGLAGLTASAAGIAPEAPPAEWFDDPQFTELTGLTITDDGQVFGHAWAWDTCHIGIPGVCTTAPHSNSDYAYFHLKEVVCEDGSRVTCGTITLDAPHADRELGRVATVAHYDNTGTATADIAVGEDEFGGWVAGALRGDCDADRARKLRGAVLSGDWRDVNGNLELVGLLAVNVPGFPVPRTRALVASGDGEPKVLALIAAGVHKDGVVAGIRASTAFVSDADARELEVLGDIAAGTYEALAEQAIDA